MVLASRTVSRLRAVSAALLSFGALAVFAARDGAPAYELAVLPDGVDTLSTLAAAVSRIEACEGGCPGVVYFWSSRMPLSRSAIPNVESAARKLGVELTLVGFEELERYAESGGLDGSAPSRLADAILAAGALTHAPSLVVYDGVRLVGTAIVGYKEAAAYEAVIAARLAGGVLAPTIERASLLEESGTAEVDVLELVDYPVVGVPGAYFRWVPGRGALAYESGGRIYLLDLVDGENRVAPGFIDFVPTPDGRYFVTPGPRNLGLGFFDADEVFDAARRGRSDGVRPIFVDERMHDQYPSVGILAQDETSVRYRVLTSWFEGLVYREYEVRHGVGDAPATVRVLGEPVVPCAGMGLSTPIMSQDGTEVAAREEASGTTKIFRILPEGRCEEALSLGMPTRKVAWHSSGRKLAFSTPRLRTMAAGGAEPGIFLYDRDERRVTRVADSDGASQLAFPDFVDQDAVVFLVPGRTYGEESFFRVVRPVP